MKEHPDPTTQQGQLAMLAAMVEIRTFEDECHRLFAEGLIRGTTHLGQGQEAVSVGACFATRPGDTMTCTYRGHAATLAMGTPLAPAFGEMMARVGGLCNGKGGSMHLTDVSVGALGSFAIVGGHLPISVGAAFAARYRKNGAVNLCFFGDGSTNIGAFHESLNMAAVWKLPVIFVCENNLYGEYSPIAATTAVTSIAERAPAYGLEKICIDGNDVVAVHETVATAVANAREGGGPALIEAMTYRHKGHARSDPATYRPQGELESWLERDPIDTHERFLSDQGVETSTIDSTKSEAIARVNEALQEAHTWPHPDPESRLENVYA
jgi:TPP-dependent pyruvate/acetoin dehydrogenase alpha subunit